MALTTALKESNKVIRHVTNVSILSSKKLERKTLRKSERSI